MGKGGQRGLFWGREGGVIGLDEGWRGKGEVEGKAKREREGGEGQVGRGGRDGRSKTAGARQEKAAREKKKECKDKGGKGKMICDRNPTLHIVFLKPGQSFS